MSGCQKVGEMAVAIKGRQGNPRGDGMFRGGGYTLVQGQSYIELNTHMCARTHNLGNMSQYPVVTCSFSRGCHWGKLGEGYMGSLCIVSYNHI